MADGDPTQQQTPQTPQQPVATPQLPPSSGNGFTQFLHNYAMIHTGLAAQQFRAEQEQKQQQAALMTNMIMQYPEATANQDFMNMYGKLTSKEMAQSVGQLAQIRKMHMQGAQGQMGQLFGGGGQQQQPQGAPPIPEGSPRNFDQEIQHGEQFMASQAFNDLPPNAQKAVQDHVKDLEEQRRAQPGLELRKEAHEDTEADRAQSRAIQEQSHADSEEFKKIALQQQKQALADKEQHDKEMLDLKKEEDSNKREAQLQNITKSLDSSRDKILGDFSKSPTPAVKARVDSYNSSAGQFYRKHAGSGAPTLLKYSEEPGKVYGTNPKVDAVPPSYGTNKKTGKSGWIDADGYFYPDQD